MSLLSFDLSLDQLADSTSYSWNVFQPDGVSPSDISNATARMMIRSVPSDPVPLVSITSTLSSQGQLVLGGALGTVGLNITKVATALLGVGAPRGLLSCKYIYDVFLDLPTGKSVPIVSGTVFVRLAITH